MGARYLPLPPQVGDAKRDGVFDYLNIVKSLQASKYFTGERANWEEGDWNGDDRFDQLDLMAALQAGTYIRQASEQAEIDDFFAQIGADDGDLGTTLQSTMHCVLLRPGVWSGGVPFFACRRCSPDAPRRAETKLG